jgi:ParB-like chromosome segregation protein Spo0J
MGARASDELLESLLPGRFVCLKTRPDGMILDGHHRIKVLRERGVNVDTLPREIHEKEDQSN